MAATQRRFDVKPSAQETTKQKPDPNEKLHELFESYMDRESGGRTKELAPRSDEDCIRADGIERLCADLNLHPEEYRVLILAWNLRASTMCCFTRAEFVTGCQRLGADSLAGISTALPGMLEEVRSSRSEFKDMYRWSYRFALDSDTGQRTLPIEVAITLWQLVFTESRPLLLDQWLQFLVAPLPHGGGALRGITRDTWDMFVNFVEVVGGASESLAAYDDTEAWPSLFDDFVEWMTADQLQCGTGQDDHSTADQN